MRRLFLSLFAATLAAGCVAGPEEPGTDGGPECVPGDPACDPAACEPGQTTCVEDPDPGEPSPTGQMAKFEQVRSVCAESNVGPRLLRRLTRAELEASLKDIFPEIAGSWAGVRLSPDSASALGFTTDAAALVVAGPTAKEMLKTAEEVAELVTAAGTLASLLPCSTTGGAACATEFVEDIGLRLFRRPLTAPEVGQYVDYFSSVSQRSDFETGLKWTLVALIQSPRAFYRSEIGTPTAGGYALSQHEIATNLAYTYAGTTPDQALLDKAAAGGLSDAASVRAEAERLLATDKGRAALHAFFVEWLEYKQILGQSRDDLSNFADQVSPLLIEETRAFIDKIVFQDEGDVADLMTANFTVLNQELASFYGMGGVSSGGWEPVTRPEGRGIGLLAQGSLLARTAHQTATSPTLRGLLVFTDFMCNTKPKPPAIIPSIEETTSGVEAATTREKYELTHSVGACGNCHKPFEPYGYTLEQFDELGRYRADENGVPINTVATAYLPDGSQQEFTSLEDVAQLVTQNDDIENCVSGLLSAYLLSGAGGTNCLAEPQRKALAAGELGIKDFALSLSETAHFTTRR